MLGPLEWIVDDTTNQTFTGPDDLNKQSTEFTASVKDSDCGVVLPGGPAPGTAGHAQTAGSLTMQVAHEIEMQARDGTLKLDVIGPESEGS